MNSSSSSVEILNIAKEEDLFEHCDARVHVRVQQRNGKKYLTTIEGLDPKVDHQKVVKALRKILSCNGTIIKGKNVIQLQGKHGEKVKAFLVEEKICEKSGVIVHGE